MFKEGYLQGESFIRTIDTLQKWFSGPVILASSSDYRKKSLEKIGFKNVTTFPMPDSEEKNTNLRILDSVRPSWQDPYCIEIPSRVASSKIEYIIRQNPIPPRAMLVSLDTLAMSFKYTSKDHQNPEPMWRSHPFPKAESVDSLRQIIFQNFFELTQADNNLSEITEKMPNASSTALSLLKYGYFSRLVAIDTAIALRLPYHSDIVTASARIFLELNRVYSINNDPQKLNQLINQIFKITEKSGRSPLDISGGIDYSNPKILKLLGAKEISLQQKDSSSKSNSDLYSGFPKVAFQNFLFSQAQKASL